MITIYYPDAIIHSNSENIENLKYHLEQRKFIYLEYEQDEETTKELQKFCKYIDQREGVFCWNQNHFFGVLIDRR